MISSAFFHERARLVPIVSFAILFAGCSGGAVVGSDSGTGIHDGGGTNPLGLGPAPIALGSTTDLAAAGSYVLLAKTGITNVTGSSIAGGNVGLSPAAASFITGFALVADPTNVFSTSPSVVAPAQIYASDYAVPTPTNLTTAVLAMELAYTDGAGRTGTDFLDMSSGNLGGLTLAPGLYTWGRASPFRRTSRSRAARTTSGSSRSPTTSTSAPHRA